MKQKHDLAWILGLIASCIAIFTFITGWQSIKDIFIVPLRASQSPTPNLDVLPTPKAKDVLNPTQTFLPTLSPAPIIGTPIDIAANYPTPQGISVSLTPSNESGINIIIKFPGDNFDREIYSQVPYSLWTAVKDINDHWTIDKGIVDTTYFDVFLTTFVATVAGNYALSIGNSGIIHGDLNVIGCDVKYIFFPVQSGYVTNIVFTPARLEVGVLSPEGNAVRGEHVGLDCQGTDITGKQIAFNQFCDDPKNYCSVSFTGKWTDATGLATIFVAPGTYMIRFGKDWYQYQVKDVALSPGETKRIVVTEAK